MGTIGIAIPESVWSARSEQFYTQVLHGLEDTAVQRGHTVLSHVARSAAEEIEVLQRWHDSALADVVILKDLREDDPRPRWARDIGLPFIVIGDLRQHDVAAAVSVDNGGTMRLLLEDLRRRGHQAIGHVGGPSVLLHSRWRREAYRRFLAEHELPVLVAEGDYSADSGARATGELLAGAQPPTVIVYDNDAMAIAGCRHLIDAGRRVPQDVSVVAWDDSPACRTHQPPLAVLAHQPHQLGIDIGRAAAALLEDPARPIRLSHGVPPLVPRGTVIDHRPAGVRMR